MPQLSIKDYYFDMQEDYDWLVKKYTYFSQSTLWNVSAVKAFCNTPKDQEAITNQLDYIRFGIAKKKRKKGIPFSSLLDLNLFNLVGLVFSIPYFFSLLIKFETIKFINVFVHANGPQYSGLRSMPYEQSIKSLLFIPTKAIEIPSFLLAKIAEGVLSTIASSFRVRKLTPKTENA